MPRKGYKPTREHCQKISNRNSALLNKLLSKKLLLQRYLIKRKSIEKIAKELDYSYTAIRYRLLKYNVPIRTRSEANKGISRNKGSPSPNYIDGRSLKKYFCIDCGNEISYQSWFYGSKKCVSCVQKGDKGNKNGMFGKQHTKETRKKMKENHANIYGKKNPMFGKPAAKRSGIGKGTYYNNIWMRSSWEVLFAQFLDLSNIKWIYESKNFNLGESTYTPDFYIPEWDLYIEIKGYASNIFKKKFSLFKKLYPKVRIKVLKQKDLKNLGIL